MEANLIKTNQKLVEVLGKEKGYFGRVNTYGQRPTKYEYIGYELTEDFMPILEKMSEEQRKNLVKIINYFEMHVNPLRKLLNTDGDSGLYDLYSEIAWSHFMTVVMFGMLEVAVKLTSCAKYDKKKYLIKLKSIKCFLETNLSQGIKDNISARYRVEKNLSTTKINNFSDVIDHLWSEIRSGFIHEAGLQSKGLEPMVFGDGDGSESNPIRVESDVPMHEFLKITWQAILNSYGYKGLLKSPTLKYI